jgi:RNA polymerase sigma factor (sigma-70 family)
MHTDDQHLLDRWTHQNDPEAFRALVVRYGAMVYAACRRVLNDSNGAEDAAQECFEALARAGDKPGPYLGAWLHRVATYHALNLRRREGRIKAREHAYANTSAAAPPKEWNEIYAHVDEAINALPEKLRAPLVAYYLEQQAQGAVAESLGVSRQLVNSRIAKGVESVRAALQKKGIFTAATATLSMLLQAHAAEAVPTQLTARFAKLALAGPNSAAPLGAQIALQQTLAQMSSARKPWWPIATAVATLVLGFVSFVGVKWPASEATPVVPPAPAARAAPAPSTPAKQHLAALQTPADIVPAIEPAQDDEATASITGVLRSADGEPLANYRVQACPLGGVDPYANEHATWSGSDGAFVLDGLEAGRYFVYTWESVRPSLLPFMQHTMIALFPTLTQDTVVTLAANEQLAGLELVLNEGPTIEGRVVDLDGNPLDGVQVLAQPGSAPKSVYRHPLAAEVKQDIPGSFAFNHNSETFLGKADDSGNFKVFGLADAEYLVTFFKDGYRPVERLSRFRAGTKGLEIVLVKIGNSPIAGRVIDAETKEPIPAFEVGYSRMLEGIWGDLHEVLLRRNVTDKNGRFVLELDGDNGNGFVFAQAPGHYRNIKHARSFTSGKEAPNAELTIELPRSRTVRGRVVDEEDQPVANAKLFLGSPPNPTFSGHDADAIGVAGHDGSFEIALPANRELVLSALLQEFLNNDEQKYTGDSVVIPPTDGEAEEVVIRITRNGATVRGTVAFLGKPLHTRVDVRSKHGFDVWIGGSDASGAFEIRQLPPMREAEITLTSTLSDGFGPYAPANGVAYKLISVRRKLEIASKASLDVDLDFVGGNAQVQGRIQIEGQPQSIEYLSISISVADGAIQDYLFGADESGGFTAGGLPAGEGVLSVSAVTQDGTPGHWKLPFTLTPGQALELPCGLTLDNVAVSEVNWTPY